MGKVARQSPTTIKAFDKLIYDACSMIPKGKVSTYKQLAAQIGSPKAYRAVGSALRRNPFAPKVPCHRVVASDRTLGGFHGSTDPNGETLKRKRRMLEEEGVSFESVSVAKVAVDSIHAF